MCLSDQSLFTRHRLFSSNPITKALASKTHTYKTHQIPILLEKERLINVHHHQLNKLRERERERERSEPQCRIGTSVLCSSLGETTLPTLLLVLSEIVSF